MASFHENVPEFGEHMKIVLFCWFCVLSKLWMVRTGKYVRINNVCIHPWSKPKRWMRDSGFAIPLQIYHKTWNSSDYHYVHGFGAHSTNWLNRIKVCSSNWSIQKPFSPTKGQREFNFAKFASSSNEWNTLQDSQGIWHNRRG